MLAREGFVEVLPQKGTRVSRPSRRTTVDALVVLQYMARASLGSPLPSTSAASMPGSGSRRTAADDGGRVSALEVGGALRDIVATARNRTLDRAACAICEHLRWAEAVLPAVVQEIGMDPATHDDLVAAIVERDGERADAAMRAWRDQVLAPPPSRPLQAGRSIPRKLLRDQVYASILDALADGTLTAGDHLREDDLMTWLGVSRTPVKEALNRLEMIGVVEMLAGRQALLPAFDPYRLGEALEALAIFSDLALCTVIPHMGDDARTLLIEHYDAMRDGATLGDFGAAISCFSAALLQLGEVSENATLNALMASITPWLYKDVGVTLTGDVTRIADYGERMGAAVRRADGAEAAVLTSQLLRCSANALRAGG
ncbi:GntR family transcriptional regulator [Microbacterium oxydans]|nr:GntR family transcriptional regulator [Microbacterium oxydans]